MNTPSTTTTNNLATCAICYNDNMPHEVLGPCAHLLHRACAERMINNDCPLCRTPLWSKKSINIQVIAWNQLALLSTVIERGFDSDDTEIDGWQQQGYLYKSEHPDYDSENPDSDIDYPDEPDENDF